MSKTIFKYLGALIGLIVILFVLVILINPPTSLLKSGLYARSSSTLSQKDKEWLISLENKNIKPIELNPIIKENLPEDFVSNTYKKYYNFDLVIRDVASMRHSLTSEQMDKILNNIQIIQKNNLVKTLNRNIDIPGIAEFTGYSSKNKLKPYRLNIGICPDLWSYENNTAVIWLGNLNYGVKLPHLDKDYMLITFIPQKNNFPIAA